MCRFSAAPGMYPMSTTELQICNKIIPLYIVELDVHCRRVCGSSVVSRLGIYWIAIWPGRPTEMVIVGQRGRHLIQLIIVEILIFA